MRTTILTYIFSGLLLSAGAFPLAAQNLSSEDRAFLEDAAKGGQMEVKMGQLAHQKASSPGVKNFAQRLINDHSKANTELASLASKKGVVIPALSLTSDFQGLDSMSGPSFDTKFASMAIEDHEKDIAAFEKEASTGGDPEVKQWAAKMLPTLRAHLDAAKALKH